MPSMFDNMYIPWTPRGKKPLPPSTREPEAVAAEPPTSFKTEDLCPRTLYVARAIIAEAVDPFPEVLRAIGAAFLAFHRGELNIDLKTIFASIPPAVT